MSAAATVKGWCPGARRPMRTGDGLLLRLRLTGGVLRPEAAAAIAEASERFGSGMLDLTSRGNLQLRGISEATLAPLQAMLGHAGLLDGDAASESVRNVLASPLAGLDPACHPAIPALARALEQALMTERELHALPAKFGFLLDGGGRLPLDGVEADVRFVAAADGRFAVEAGGRAMGVCEESDVVDSALALARAFLRLRQPDDRRMRAVAHGLAPPGACAPPSRKSGRDSEAPRRIASEEGSVRLSLRAFGQVNEPSLPLPDFGEGGDRRATGGDRPRFFPAFAPFGRLMAAQLGGLATIARAEGAELRLTPWRAILVAPAPRPLDADIGRLGLVVDQGDPRLAVAACPGSAGCASGEADIQKDAVAFAQALAPLLDDGVSVHVSGCRKGCARRLPASFTLVAEAGRYGLAREANARAPRETTLMTADEMTTFLCGLAAGRLGSKSFENA